MRGKFIALEGGEGTGKSTQAKLLAAALEKNGIQCIVTREPGGTDGAEAIRSLLLSPPGSGWGARAEALLFAAARSDHVEKLIRPNVERGAWVICDRYLDSSRAYQGGAGGIGDEAIIKLHEIGSEGMLPDLTLLIDVPADNIAARLQQRDGDISDAIGGRATEYHTAVAETFKTIASAEAKRFAAINGAGTPEEVHQTILTVVQERLGAR